MMLDMPAPKKCDECPSPNYMPVHPICLDCENAYFDLDRKEW